MQIPPPHTPSKQGLKYGLSEQPAEGCLNNKSVRNKKDKPYFQNLISKAKNLFKSNKNSSTKTSAHNREGTHIPLATSFPKNLEELDAQIHTLAFLSEDKTLSKKASILVKSKINQLQYLKEEGPLSEKAYKNIWDLKRECFQQWVQQNVPPLQKRQAQKLIDGYFNANALDFKNTPSKKMILEAINKGESDVISLLKDYGLIDSRQAPDSIHKSLAALSESILSKRPKTEIAEQLYFEHKNHEEPLELNQISRPLGECLPCSMLKTEKLTNAWKAELKTATGEVIMSNYRHATLCAFGETDKKTRETLNLQRAEELVMNMIDIQAIEEQIKARTENHNAPLIIPIISNNLESADNLRDAANKLMKNDRGQAMNERRHIREQTLALQQACKNKTIELEVEGIGMVKIVPQVLAFNFGVNEFALKTGITKVGSTWENSKQTNQQALEALLGEQCLKTGHTGEFGGLVGVFLADSKDEKKKKIVNELATQIATIYKDGSYKTAGKEPYKMVARLSVLSHLIGAKVCTNCKSGKDRTSMAVAEANYLAMRIHRDGVLPEVDQELNTQERQELMQFVFGKTHYEIQSHNRGAKGYKLGGIDALNKRVIGENNPLFDDLFEGLAYTT